jgi:hypothetical protein
VDDSASTAASSQRESPSLLPSRVSVTALNSYMLAANAAGGGLLVLVVVQRHSTVDEASSAHPIALGKSPIGLGQQIVRSAQPSPAERRQCPPGHELHATKRLASQLLKVRTHRMRD